MEYDEGGEKEDRLRHKLVTFQFKVFSNISVKVNRKGNFFIQCILWHNDIFMQRSLHFRTNMSINYSISCAQHGIIHYCGMVTICLLSQFRYTVSFDRRFQVEDRVGQWISMQPMSLLMLGQRINKYKSTPSCVKGRNTVRLRLTSTNM